MEELLLNYKRINSQQKHMNLPSIRGTQKTIFSLPSFKFFSFDKDLYMTNADFSRLDFQEILSDFSIVRQYTSSLITCLSNDAWIRTGII